MVTFGKKSLIIVMARIYLRQELHPSLPNLFALRLQGTR